MDHLRSLTDGRGIHEHACFAIARHEHGYCVDDNARLLVVATRAGVAEHAADLSRLALRFVLAALDAHGRVRNRLSPTGTWTDRAGTEDCWGRAVCGLGVAAVQHLDPAMRASAMTGFDRAIGQRSSWRRAMAFAALGAVEVLEQHPDHERCRSFLRDAAAAMPPVSDGSWRWPEPRLAYANATLAEAAIATGRALGDDGLMERGLVMLRWLLDLETREGHLSVVPVGGRGHGEVGPGFDQQPIEAAAMADACWRAYVCTGDAAWLVGVNAADRWFAGDNDAGALMADVGSGGGFDGLRIDGVNLNMGAESTLAYVSTRQRASSVMTCR